METFSTRLPTALGSVLRLPWRNNTAHWSTYRLLPILDEQYIWIMWSSRSGHLNAWMEYECEYMNILAYSEMWKVFAVVCVPVCGGLRNGSLWQSASVSVVKLSDSVVLTVWECKCKAFMLLFGFFCLLYDYTKTLELKTIHVQTFLKWGLLSRTAVLKGKKKKGQMANSKCLWYKIR